ncbi:MAG: AAA family ATPase [Muribaculaceae bacterium]|nr:AAA family ATPase [Muribaculaceae bacterium]
MKFLRLEILNLASLDNPDGEIINFESGALGDATIFSIVGPTGSGKSTILDAICLALYNRAPRYPRKKGERNSGIEIYGTPEAGESNRLAPTDSRNILTRGKRKGYSKLTFLSNAGTLYRAEWHVKFNYRNYERPLTLLYAIAADGTETEAEWDTLPLVIGLDYEQFLRTVLIAQGSFAGFLNAREEERAELLEKLIGAEERYAGISESVRQARSEANEHLRGLRAEHSAYARFDLSDEQLEALREEIGRLEGEEKRVRAEQTTLREEQAWHTALAALNEKVTAAEKGVAVAGEALEARRPEAERLALYDRAATGLKLYGDMVVLRKRAVALGKDMERAGEEISAAGDKEKAAAADHTLLMAEADKAEKYLAELAPRIRRARQWLGEAGTLREQLGARSKEREQLAGALEKGTQALESNAKAIAGLTSRREELSASFASLEKETEKATKDSDARMAEARKELDTLQEKFAAPDADALKERKRSLDARVMTLTQRVHILKEAETVGERLAHDRKEVKTLAGRNAEIEKEVGAMPVAALEKEVDVLKETRLLITGNDWVRQRHLLEEGNPCPLCGATHHPFADEGTLRPHVMELDTLISGKEEDLKRLTALRDTLLEESHRNSGLSTRLATSISDDEKRLKQLSAQIATPEGGDDAAMPATADECSKVLADTIAEADRAGKALEECNALHAKVNAALKHIDKLRGEAEKTRASFAEKLKKMEECRAECEKLLAAEKGRSGTLASRQEELREQERELAGKIKELEEGVALRSRNAAEEIGDSEPDRLEAEVTSQLDKCRKDAREAEKILADTREKVRELSGRIRALEQQRNESLAEAEARDSELEDWLLGYNFTNSARIDRHTLADLAASGEDRESLRRSLKEAEESVTVARTLLDENRRLLAAHEEKRPERPVEELERRLAELEEHSTAALDEARARMRGYVEARGKMGEMYAVLKEAEELAADWNAIAEAIGGDGKTLRKIAQCYTLGFLIEHANREIRRFNTRYELRQVRNSLGIRVIDHERGDDVRDTTSLSGGETFIVSLGLALGLSALSSRNVSFDNLFIDEGFGSLDPDTLSTVIDSLAMLQSSQGKKVGVISHTDTMSERIPTQIRIIRNGRSGSSRIELYPS